jgi:hypothetical protein
MRQKSGKMQHFFRPREAEAVCGKAPSMAKIVRVTKIGTRFLAHRV